MPHPSAGLEGCREEDEEEDSLKQLWDGSAAEDPALRGRRGRELGVQMC